MSNSALAGNNRLDVFFGDERVGSIEDTSPLSFDYADEWLNRQEPAAVAAIPLTAGRNSSPAVQAFFENLLPEGELRSYIASAKKASPPCLPCCCRSPVTPRAAL